MSRRKYTNQQVIDAVASSTSLRQVLNKLDLKSAGGNYASIKKLIVTLKLDTKHILGQAIHRGQRFGPKRPLEDYLSNLYSIQSHKLRLRLLRENVFPHQCARCNRKTWLNQPIPLELEHKDGNHLNNNLDNLELLCPNCHAFTSTYRGKNISKKA